MKIALAEDHLPFRQNVKRLLENEPDFQVIFEASNGLEVIEELHSLESDVLVLDLSMPEVDGFEVLKHTRVKRPALKSIVLSGHKGNEYNDKALEMGASAYVLKDNLFTDLIPAVRKAVIG